MSRNQLSIICHNNWLVCENVRGKKETKREKFRFLKILWRESQAVMMMIGGSLTQKRTKDDETFFSNQQKKSS
jgi:hypothetical protein